MLTIDLEELRRAYVKNSRDWPYLLVLADCCEEIGEQKKADCLRWMVKRNKRPLSRYDGKFSWMSGSNMASCLPPSLINQMPQGQVAHQWVREFATPLQALDAMFLAWEKAPQE